MNLTKRQKEEMKEALRKGGFHSFYTRKGIWIVTRGYFYHSQAGYKSPLLMQASVLKAVAGLCEVTDVSNRDSFNAWPKRSFYEVRFTPTKWVKK